MAEIKNLEIDIESFSDVDLIKCGVYKYASAPDFEIILFAYSVDGGPVRQVDLACGEKIPAEIIAALEDDTVTKWAFNANFERVCLSRYLGYPTGDYLMPDSWRCSMVWSAYLGLPLSLEGVGTVLGLEKQKLTEGKNLIKYFCQPCAPTKSNGGRTRNLPADTPEKWEAFKNYNIRDVEVEMAIQARLSHYPVPESIWEEYHLDQEINDRGIMIDRELVDQALLIDARSKSDLMARIQAMTGLDNPNSVQQLKSYLADRGIEADSLGKKEVDAMIKTVPGDITEVLSLRLQLAKSSVKKYQAMRNSACEDERCRGMFFFYGANRTGRFSGRIIQLQNLPQNHIPDLVEARSLVKCGDYEALELLYENIPEVLSELIRTAFVPQPGYKFCVADFSSIEARVLAWLAGETWRLELFSQGGDIYCQSASKMFGVPVEKHGVNGHLRQKGKVAELACIAEGQLVLTDQGEVPIQEVTKDMKVWDGEEWVPHDGPVYRGEREVITYEGLTATADHLVWVEGQPEPVPFGFAAASGAHLVQTGDRGQAVRLGSHHQPGKTMELTYHQRTARLYDLRNAGPRHRFTVSGHLVHNCGYGGSTGALKSMGALEMGLAEEELQPLVDSWRTANPNIVRFWWDVDRAVKTAVKQREPSVLRGIRFECRSGMLFITLPSGRRLSYVKPRIGENRFGTESVTYEGVGGTKKWERIESYGPKFVENIVQAISRDILCYAMRTLSHCRICAHVHDELIIECRKDASLDAICEQMGRTPPWAEGLVLRADGYETQFYKKD